MKQRMYIYVLAGSTIFVSGAICKIHEKANITNRTLIAQIRVAQIERRFNPKRRAMCVSSCDLRLHGHSTVVRYVCTHVGGLVTSLYTGTYTKILLSTNNT